MQYTDTLQTMVGHIRRVKPNADFTLARDWINERIRELMQLRPIWACMIRDTLVSVPAVYNTGNITLATGSAAVTGTATSWPVSDAVNTTSATAVFQPGETEVTPASMAGITLDSILVVDAGASQEIVYVAEVKPASFIAKFTKTHSGTYTITSSSLANRQLRISLYTPPITVLAVTSATAMTLQVPWGDAPLTNSTYELLKLYYVISPGTRGLISSWEPFQGIPMAFRNVTYLEDQDPRRTAYGPPWLWADRGPNPCNNMTYELYPPQRGARQIPVKYSEGMRDMVDQTDRPPAFIDPMVLINGAMSKALRTRVIDDRSKADPWYDLATADYYEKKFQDGVAKAIYADNTLLDQALSYKQDGYPQGGANFWQSHDPDVLYGNF